MTWPKRGYYVEREWLSGTQVATISSAQTSQSAVQAGWGQLRMQQARRTADQAEAEAQSLRLQAANAQRSADHAEANAQSLTSAASQAESDAGRARQGLVAMQTTGNMVAVLSNTVQQVLTKQQAQQAPQTTPTPAPAPAVTNSQGQVTGTIVNVTA